MPTGWHEFGLIGFAVVSFCIWRYLPRTFLPAILLVVANYFGWINWIDFYNFYKWYFSALIYASGQASAFALYDKAVIFTTVFIIIAVLGTFVGLWLDLNSPNIAKVMSRGKKEEIVKKVN